MDRISDINYAKKLEEKKETARKFLEQGVDKEIVIKATGLTKEEIEEITSFQINFSILYYNGGDL